MEHRHPPLAIRMRWIVHHRIWQLWIWWLVPVWSRVYRRVFASLIQIDFVVCCHYFHRDRDRDRDRDSHHHRQLLFSYLRGHYHGPLFHDHRHRHRLPHCHRHRIPNHFLQVIYQILQSDPRWQ